MSSDPEGIRSIGVLTKCDLQKDSVYDRLTGVGKNAAKFKLGVFGLFNIASNSDEEKNFFVNLSKELGKSAISEDKYGINSLTAQLVRVQSDRMKKAIPNMKRQIDFQLLKSQEELDSLPAGVTTNVEAVQIASKILNEFGKRVQDLYEVNYNETFHDEKLLHFMPRMKELGEKFIKNINNNKSCIFSTEYAEKIKKEHCELRGRTMDNMSMSKVFDRLFTIETSNLFKTTAWDFLENAHEYMCQCLQNIADLIPGVKSSYPLLNDTIKDEIVSITREKFNMCKTHIQEKLDTEIGDFFTENVQYGKVINNIGEGYCYACLKNQDNQVDSGFSASFDHDFVVKCIAEGQVDKTEAENKELDEASKSYSHTPDIENGSKFAVLELQCKLYSAREIVVARFFDSVIGVVRLNYLRYFSKNITNAMFDRILHDKLTQSLEVSQDCGLLSLMPDHSASRRRELTYEIQRFKDAKLLVKNFLLDRRK